MIKLIQGDITKLKVDAIVNAANSSLMGGGGVDGAIHRAGGRSIIEECRRIVEIRGPLNPGGAVITKAGNLPARHVIHTVGPIWYGGNKNEVALLAGCYHNSLNLAQEHKLKSIAFPNISTGIFGFPKDTAAEISIATIQKFLETTKSRMQVTLVCFDVENYDLLKALLPVNGDASRKAESNQNL